MSTERIPIWNEYIHPSRLPNIRNNWLWVYCRIPYCGHSRAVPLAPWIIRWGSEDVCQMMRRYFRCAMCGTRGCVFGAPLLDGVGIEPFPPRERLVRLGGSWPSPVSEVRWQTVERKQAEYLIKYPTGDALGEFRGTGRLRFMCNLYSVKVGQKHIADTAGALRDLTGNMPPLPAIFPNRMAPVVRVAPDGVRELIMMRWGFPPPSIPGSKPRNPYLTNVRNTDSRYWQTYLKKPEARCLVPVTSFAEPDNNQGPKSVWTWFAQDESRPLMFFAGIWREWEGDRGTKAAPDVGMHRVFSFLTTDASPDVVTIHPDATPVLLLDEGAREEWMNAPWEIARELQKPPPKGALMVVATDTKQDSL